MNKDFEREVLERLRRIEDGLFGVDGGDKGLIGRVADHERRLRAVEKLMWSIMGLLGIWEAILTAMVVKLLTGR